MTTGKDMETEQEERDPWIAELKMKCKSLKAFAEIKMNWIHSGLYEQSTKEKSLFQYSA